MFFNILRFFKEKLILEITKTPDLMSYSSTRSEFQNTKEDLEHWFKNNRHWISKNQKSEKPIFWTNVLRHLRINSLAACPGVTAHLRCLAGVGRPGLCSLCANFSDVLAHQPQHIRPALFTRPRNDGGAHLNISSSCSLLWPGHLSVWCCHLFTFDKTKPKV